MKQNNMPAFPLPLGNESIDPSVGGMTLRDYFAAKALVICPHNYHEYDVIAEYAYKLADAMLKARG